MDKNDLLALLNGERSDPVWVCEIEQHLADILGAHTRAVLLSAETIEKQKVEHPELTLDDYLRLPNLILRGLAHENRSSQIRFIVQPSGAERGLMSVIKRTRNGNEIFAVTFHHLRLRKFMA